MSFVKKQESSMDVLKLAKEVDVGQRKRKIQGAVSNETVADVAKKTAKKESGIKKATKSVLEASVLQSVVTVSPHMPAAGVAATGEVVGGFTPLLVMKGMTEEIGGACPPVKSITIAGTGVGKPSGTYTIVTARQNLLCKGGHRYKAGDRIFQRHGTTICPKDGYGLRAK